MKDRSHSRRVSTDPAPGVDPFPAGGGAFSDESDARDGQEPNDPGESNDNTERLERDRPPHYA